MDIKEEADHQVKSEPHDDSNYTLPTHAQINTQHRNTAPMQVEPTSALSPQQDIKYPTDPAPHLSSTAQTLAMLSSGINQAPDPAAQPPIQAQIQQITNPFDPDLGYQQPLQGLSTEQAKILAQLPKQTNLSHVYALNYEIEPESNQPSTSGKVQDSGSLMLSSIRKMPEGNMAVHQYVCLSHQSLSSYSPAMRSWDTT
jgi:hypothetical protein